MHKLVLAASVAALASGSAFAAADVQTCTRGSDVRSIEVLQPGEVGAACDLKYVRDNGANVSVPYHANNSVGFCAERARDLVQSLVDAGYACGAEQQVAAVETLDADPIEVSVEDTATPELVEVAVAAEPTPAPAVAEPVTQALASAEPALAELETAPTPVATAPAAVPVAPAIADAEPIIAQSADEPVEGGILGQPVLAAGVGGTVEATSQPKMANGGPVALTTTNASATATAAPRPRTSVVGRLVGAAPDERPITTASDPQVVEERLPAVSAPTPAATPKETKVAALSVSRPSAKTRPSEDIIKSVLAAQAAAWNEGDLEAFMRGYWKSPDLRFVSGTTVAKGWNQTLKRYRDRYGDDNLGRLGFDSLDVDMVTDDVAVVVGRFNLDRNGKADTGAFTLVMKRFDGLWRIVHDHSVADSSSTD